MRVIFKIHSNREGLWGEVSSQEAVWDEIRGCGEATQAKRRKNWEHEKRKTQGYTVEEGQEWSKGKVDKG